MVNYNTKHNDYINESVNNISLISETMYLKDLKNFKTTNYSNEEQNRQTLPYTNTLLTSGSTVRQNKITTAEKDVVAE